MGGNVIVIGGGTAGMEAAGQLAKSGYKVTILEKEETTGGHLNNWYHLFPDRRDGGEVIAYLNKLTDNENVKIINGCDISNIDKNRKLFTVKTSKGEMINADAVIVATGFDLFKSERKEEYGYGIYENVITSADLEKMFRKNEVRTKIGDIPKRVGMVHCVGSRDEKVGNRYCSKLCCVTAVKQAIEIREHIPDSKVYCFYMDMRMGGAFYEELYMESQEHYGVNYIRGKVSEVGEFMDHKLQIKVEDTLLGRPLKIELDLLVLMAGMEISSGSKKIAEILNLKRGENQFFQSRDNHFGSNLSNVDGLFYAGTCTAPMNITETISHARAAVDDAVDYMKTLD